MLKTRDRWKGVGAGGQGFLQDAVAPDAFQADAVRLVPLEVVGRDRHLRWLWCPHLAAGPEHQWAAGLSRLQRHPGRLRLRLRGARSPPGAGRCWWCVRAGLITDALAGPAGEVPARLRPLADGLVSMRRPQSGVVWLRRSAITREALRDLARGRIPCSHTALDAVGTSRAVEYLRCLLVHYDVLPPRDRRLADFQRWAAAKLDGIGYAEHRQLLERFVQWRLLRHLRSCSDTATPLGHGPYQRAKQRLTMAIAFLAWLAAAAGTLVIALSTTSANGSPPGPPPGGMSSPSCPGPVSSASSPTSSSR